jgi:hypothetical protein
MAIGGLSLPRMLVGLRCQRSEFDDAPIRRLLDAAADKKAA